jgi:hypothetical protein
VSDSGPNLGVRGAGFLFVVVGLLLISTGFRIRKGTSRLRFSSTMAIYGFGVFTLAGAGALVLGATLLGAPI